MVKLKYSATVDTRASGTLSPVWVEHGLREDIHGQLTHLRSLLSPRLKNDPKVFVVADGNIWHHYHQYFLERIPNLVVALVDGGEHVKSWDMAQHLLEEMDTAGLGKHDFVVSFGGGTVTDLTGFCASIYRRGVRLVHIPTTLLAMVDAAIGGKTGINAGTKNSIGTVYQPAGVFVDPVFLKTLPTVQLVAGYAEVIKYGVIWAHDLFDLLDNMPPAPLMSTTQLTDIIEQCVRIKARICSMDPFEHLDVRHLLNFGHTFGHAIESALGFTVLHGEAVALGMLWATGLSVEAGLCDRRVYERIDALLQVNDLPTHVEDLGQAAVDILTPRVMVAKMTKDKKVEGTTLPLILVDRLGQGKVTRTLVSERMLEDYLQQVLYSR